MPRAQVGRCDRGEDSTFTLVPACSGENRLAMPLDPLAVDPATVVHHLPHERGVVFLSDEMEDDVSILLVVVEERGQGRLEIRILWNRTRRHDAYPFALRDRLEQQLLGAVSPKHRLDRHTAPFGHVLQGDLFERQPLERRQSRIKDRFPRCFCCLGASGHPIWTFLDLPGSGTVGFHVSDINTKYGGVNTDRDERRL